MNDAMTRRSTLFVLGIFFISGLAFRLYQIATPSYWLDEMFSLYIAKQNTWSSLLWDSNPFLYHLLLRIWINWSGENELFVRLLSTLFSCGSVILIYFLGKRIAGPAVGLIASFLMVVSPLGIQYSQEARMYSLFEFLTVVHLIFFFNRDQDRKSRIGWIISLALLLMTHLFSFLLLWIELIWIFFHKQEENLWKRIGLSLLVFGTLPPVLVKLTGFQLPFLDWQKLRYGLVGFSSDLESFLSLLFSGSIANLVALLLGTVLLLIGNRRDFLQRVEFRFVCLLLIVPILLCSIFSLSLERIFLVPRYFIFLNPVAIILTSLLISNLFSNGCMQRLGSILLLISCLLSSLLFLPEVYKNKKAPWRSVAQYISNIPRSVVLTTRSQSIQSPYFERFSIPVRKWIPNENGLQFIEQLLSENKNVFIVDNFWGGLTYWNENKSRLSKLGYKLNEQIFKLDDSEPIYAMQIRK
jgi:uncharacterized membrane protein